MTRRDCRQVRAGALLENTDIIMTRSPFVKRFFPISRDFYAAFAAIHVPQGQFTTKGQFMREAQFMRGVREAAPYNMTAQAFMPFVGAAIPDS